MFLELILFLGRVSPKSPHLCRSAPYRESFVAIAVMGATALVSTVFGRVFSFTFPLLASKKLLSKPEKHEVARKKYVAEGWQLLLHVGFTLWNIRLMKRLQWEPVLNTRMVWDDFKAFDDSFERDEYYSDSNNTELRLFLLCQLGVWLHAGIQHRFFGEVRRDYFGMFIHHIATVGLVAGTLYMRLPRVGLLVLLAHDPADVIVDLLKLFNQIDQNIPAGIFFVTNLVTWFYSRCYWFPRYIIYCTFIESWDVVVNYLHKPELCPVW